MLLERKTGESSWQITPQSHIVVTMSACLFALLISLIIYVFVKYLIVRGNCKRGMIMVFYVLTFADLFTRMAIMISLNWRPFFATENLILSICSLLFALLVGTSHAWILACLTIDLKVLNCKSEEQVESVFRTRKIYQIVTIGWIIVIIASSLFFLIDHVYEYIVIGQAALFIILSVCILYLNLILMRTMSQIFTKQEFGSERSFLNCTLLMFTFSYFVVVAHSTLIVVLL